MTISEEKFDYYFDVFSFPYVIMWMLIYIFCRFAPIAALDMYSDFAWYMGFGYAMFMLSLELYKDLIKY